MESDFVIKILDRIETTINDKVKKVKQFKGINNSDIEQLDE